MALEFANEMLRDFISCVRLDVYGILFVLLVVGCWYCSRGFGDKPIVRLHLRDALFGIVSTHLANGHECSK